MTKVEDTCDCGYFQHECECCGEGKVCPVCGKPKYIHEHTGS